MQEELLEVFEGSCALIPIKLIADECKNLVDEFVPELVETLSSEMNPDTVCTVAGKTVNVKSRPRLILFVFRSLQLQAHRQIAGEVFLLPRTTTRRRTRSRNWSCRRI